MIKTSDFTQLIGKVVKRVLIVVWPPSYETTMLDVDMSIAIEVEGEEGLHFHIAIDNVDGWTPILSKKNFGEIRLWDDFHKRLRDWMTGQIDNKFQHEVFDATCDRVFENIVFRRIVDIECVTLKSGFNPFAVKIVFQNDYIIVSPVSDGTTVETAVFNRLSNLEIHKMIGELEFVSLANRNS